MNIHEWYCAHIRYDNIWYTALVYHGTKGKGLVRTMASGAAPLYPRFSRLDPNAEAGSAEALNPQQWVSRFTGNDAGYSSKAPTSSQDSASFVQCFQWHGTDTYRFWWTLYDFFLGSRWRNRCCRWYGWGERCKNPRGQSRYRFPESCLWIRWWGFLFHFVSLFATSFAGLVS